MTNRFAKRLIPGLISAVLAAAATAETAPLLDLYVDSATKQIFAEPGPGRVKLGTFRMVDETAEQQAQQVVSQPVAAPSTSVNLGRKGLEVKSADEKFAMNLGGRMHADVSTHTNDDLVKRGTATPAEATSGTEIRRARIALSGTAYGDYSYIVEGDWAGDGVSIKDMFINYQGIDPLEITVGHQKHAMSMEIQESSNDIMFNERSLLSALTTPHFDRAIGLNLKTKGEDWSLKGGIYGDSMASSGNGGDEGSGWAVRGTYTPLNAGDRIVHLGANLGQRSANDANNLSNSKAPRFRYKTTNMSELYLTDTGAIADFDAVSLAVLEGAAMVGPWSVQSEYGKADLKRESAADADFEAWYVQAGWTLTGESRTYKAEDGEFKRLKPRNNFDLTEGHWGAWELALRYDHLDLEDSGIAGGEQDRLSVNLNWYMNENVRMLLGYSRALDVENSPVTTASGGDPTDVDVISMRTQWAF